MQRGPSTAALAPLAVPCRRRPALELSSHTAAALLSSCRPLTPRGPTGCAPAPARAPPGTSCRCPVLCRLPQHVCRACARLLASQAALGAGPCCCRTRSRSAGRPPRGPASCPGTNGPRRSVSCVVGTGCIGKVGQRAADTLSPLLPLLPPPPKNAGPPRVRRRRRRR